MKRDVPATPFKVDGPNSTWTSSSELPENPVGQLATMTRAGAQEMATMTTLAKQGQRSSLSNAGGAAQQGGSASTGQLVEEFVKKVNYVLQGCGQTISKDDVRVVMASDQGTGYSEIYYRQGQRV